MNKIKPFIGISIALFFLFTMPTIQAQVKGKVDRNQIFRPYWQVGLRVGTPVFLGDVKRYRYVPASDEWRAAAGISVSRRLIPVLELEATYNFGKLAGSDRYVNQLFESRFHEISLRGLVHLTDVMGLNENSFPVAFNLVAGAGLCIYQSTLFERTSHTLLKKSDHHKEGILLVGLNIDIRLKQNIFLRVESVNTGMHSDWMDFKKSGFPYDVYNLTMIGLNYRFRYGRGGGGYYPKKVVRRRFHRGF